MKNIIKGKILINEFGNAFINTSCGKTIYIKKPDINNAYHLEDVEVEYWKDETNNLYYGKVVNFSLIDKEFVGIVHHHFMKNTFIQTTELKKKQICLENIETYLEKGQWVRIRVINVKSNPELIIGKLLCLIENNIDTIIENKYNLTTIENNDETKFNNIEKQYIDLTHHDVFTIDPPSCIDCDDAFSIVHNYLHSQSETISIYVHISDVSKFVYPGSPQFEEFIKRGNTYYGVNKNWSMISPDLANNVCSILPNKLTHVVTIHFIYDIRKNILEYKEYFYSLIKSNKKYTYEEVDEILYSDSKYYDGFLLNHPTQVLNKISNLCIVSDIPDINITQETQSHRLVRYWMIKTNQVMCSVIGKIFRTNQPPQEYKFDLLKKYINVYSSENILTNEICKNRNQLIKYINTSTPLTPLLEHIVKKIMVKAIYTDNDDFHYGLGINGYTHFTSPIRRSCDLINQCILRGYKFTDEDINRYLGYMNISETIQDNIEEFIEKYKTYNCYKDNTQNVVVLQGIIVDITQNGIKIFIDIMKDTYNIHVSKLSSYILNFDQIDKVLYNDYTNYQLFDTLLVYIKKIDLENIEVELVQ